MGETVGASVGIDVSGSIRVGPAVTGVAGVTVGETVGETEGKSVGAAEAAKGHTNAGGSPRSVCENKQESKKSRCVELHKSPMLHQRGDR